MMVMDNGGDFEPIPLGMHRAICMGVYDVGLQPGYQGGPAHKKVVLLWELEPKSDKTGKHFTVTKIYTQSIGDKSSLGADLASWRTRPFTADEKKGFELNNVLGKPCQLNLIAGGKDGDRAVVQVVLPADKSRPYWTPETTADYVPNFVAKMRDQRLVEMPKPASTPVMAGDGFVDDIPATAEIPF